MKANGKTARTKRLYLTVTPDQDRILRMAARRHKVKKTDLVRDAVDAAIAHLEDNAEVLGRAKVSS